MKIVVIASAARIGLKRFEDWLKDSVLRRLADETPTPSVASR